MSAVQNWPMVDIINLRQARKNRARDATAQAASEARIRHGRSKAAKLSDALDARRHDARRAGLLLSRDEADVQAEVAANLRNESESTS